MSHRRFLRRGSFFALLIAAGAGNAFADRVPVPGTKVTLDPPPDFALARQYSGFENPAQSASIMVTELGAPFEAVSAGLTAEGLRSRGMTLVAAEDVTVAERAGRLLQIRQTAPGGAEFEKWMLAFGDPSTTLLIVASYPQAVAASLGPTLRASVLTATWQPDAAVDLDEGLTFSIGESAHLRIEQRMQNALLFGDPDHDPASELPAPIVVFGASIGSVDIDDLETFARQRVSQTTGVVELGEAEGENTVVAGLPAYELHASAKDADSGKDLVVYQLVLVAGDGYYLMQALVAASQFADLLPELREIAGSFELR